MNEIFTKGNTAIKGVVFVVKGIQRQVIVVQSPDRELFEQAIFILRDGQTGISDEALLREAKRLMGKRHSAKYKWYYIGPAWAVAGCFVTSIIWLVAMFV